MFVIVSNYAVVPKWQRCSMSLILLYNALCYLSTLFMTLLWTLRCFSFFFFFTLTTVSFIPANILCNVFFRKFAMWLLYCVYVQMKEKAVVHKDGGLDIFSPASLLQLICTCPRGPSLFSPLHKFSIQEPRRRRTQFHRV